MRRKKVTMLDSTTKDNKSHAKPVARVSINDNPLLSHPLIEKNSIPSDESVSKNCEKSIETTVSSDTTEYTATSSTKSARIEDCLINIILKYRDNQKTFFEISEREYDREYLNITYPNLDKIAQKILDSRCYLELIRIQQNQAQKFLADDTSPQQRLGMLAYIVRTVRMPLIFLAGKSTLLVRQKEKAQPLIQVNDVKKKMPHIIETVCHGKPISLEKITILKKEIQMWISDQSYNIVWSSQHAEILSQMIANKELVFPITTTHDAWVGTNHSVVVYMGKTE